MGKATGETYSEVNSPRKKPIIFWGVWLYFGPSAFGALYYAIVTGLNLVVGGANIPDDLKSDALVGSILILLVSLGYGILSFWVLWSVTKGYLRKPKRKVEANQAG